MSDHATAWAWDQEVKNPRHKLLLLKLAASANDDGVAWPSLRTMAKHTGVSKSTLSRAANALADLGLLRIQPTIKQDGSAGPNVYHLGCPKTNGSSHAGGTGVSHSGRDEGGVPSGRDGSKATSRTTTSSSTSGTEGALPAPEHITGRRWKVFSRRPGKGPFEVDLKAGTCTCENRHDSECRHRKSAAVAEIKTQRQSLADTRKGLLDAVWDALADAFGVPTADAIRKAHGGARSTIFDQLTADGAQQQTPDAFKAEVDRRFKALRDDWGTGRVTVRSFAQNWLVAGKLADEGATNGKGHGLSAQDMFDDAMRDQAAGL